MGEGPSPATNQHLLLAKVPEVVRETEEDLFLTHPTGHVPVVSSPERNSTQLQDTQHAIINPKIQLQLLPFLARINIELPPAALEAHFHFGRSQTPLGRPHSCTYATLPMQSHLSKEKLARSFQFVTKMLTLQAAGLCTTSLFGL